METEKNHSLKHAPISQPPNDIVNNVKWADSINMSCEAPETGHKDWVKKQGGKTNQGPAVALCMVQHTVQKGIHVLLCEAVQGAFLINCAYFTCFETYAYVTYFANHTYYAYFAYFIY